MKKIRVLPLILLFALQINSQAKNTKPYIYSKLDSTSYTDQANSTLIQQIKDTYNTLDSISYMDNLMSSYRKSLLEREQESIITTFELSGSYDYMDSTAKKHVYDGIKLYYIHQQDLTQTKVMQDCLTAFGEAIGNAYLNRDGSVQKQNIFNDILYIYDRISSDYNKASREKEYSLFVSNVKQESVNYVLKLLINKDSIQHGKLRLEVDTSKLNFNLFDFGKPHQTSLYVYCKKGEYAGHDSEYITFSKRLGKNAPKVFKKITQKQPTYLLYCHELEGMNTILYVLNDTIYVYRLIEMKEYELNDYLKKFKSQILSNTIYRNL